MAPGLGQVPPHEPIPPIARQPPGAHPHAPDTGSCTHSSSSDGQRPPHAPVETSPQPGRTRELVVEVDEVVVVVAQPPAPQASQQLGTDPMHALPPPGATQRAAPRSIEHDVLPDGRVRQQVTNPGLPHVDLAAQRLTVLVHPLLASAALASSAAQRT